MNLLAMLVLSTVGHIAQAFVFQKIWEWFIVVRFAVGQLSIFDAYGITALVHIVCNPALDMAAKEIGDLLRKEDVQGPAVNVAMLLFHLTYLAIALGMAYCWRHFRP